MLKNYFTKGLIEAGCDEAGRGCLAGPVAAAAVILPKNFKHKLLNDSKQVSESNRNELRHIIEEKALAFGVAFLDHKKIDEINIDNSSPSRRVPDITMMKKHTSFGPKISFGGITPR